MSEATRLVTYADVDGQAGTRVAVSARSEVQLADGSRVLLLDDRGWSSSARWAATSVQEVEATTRTVVGPDEPFDDRTQEDMAAGHWNALQQTAQRQGVAVDAAELSQLPHEVVLSHRLLALVRPGATAPP